MPDPTFDAELPESSPPLADEALADNAEEAALDVASERSIAVLELEHGSRRAMLAWRDPDVVAEAADELRSSVLESVRVMAQEARERRREGRVVASTVAPELALLGDAHDALIAVSDAVKAGALEAESIAGEIVLDVEPEKTLGSASVRVGDGHGRDLKVTRTQGAKTAADDDAIVDVLVAALAAAKLDGESEDDAISYAAGARFAIAELRQLVGPLAWKVTALDALAKRLEDREEYDLAIRLGHAYGRVSDGRPAKVKLERVERSKR